MSTSSEELQARSGFGDVQQCVCVCVCVCVHARAQG